jgi:hypothetical protein
MAKNQEFAAEIGNAWALHRKGQNEDAIRAFQGILETSGSNTVKTDVLYGMGLAQRSAGHTEAALQSFQQCMMEVNGARETFPREDRHLMLQRMTKQRIDELKAE